MSAPSPRVPSSPPVRLSPARQAALWGRMAFRQHLSALSFHGLAECVRELLTRMGYADVRLMGRTARRQRTRHGGYDLRASARTGATDAILLIQLKQYDRPVSRRFVDELRGAMLREGATQGLLITASTFSRPARQAIQDRSLLPVRLVDGGELTEWCFTHQVGVKPGRAGRLVTDTAYFERLHSRYPRTEPSGFRCHLRPYPTLPRKQPLEEEEITLLRLTWGRWTFTLTRTLTFPEER